MNQFIATSHTFQVYRYTEKCSLLLYLDVFEDTWRNHESRTIAVHHGQQQRQDVTAFLSPINSTDSIWRIIQFLFRLVKAFCSPLLTPNCNNVVIEKSKKQKVESQIGIN